MENKLDKPSQKLPNKVRENLARVRDVAVNHQTRRILHASRSVEGEVDLKRVAIDLLCLLRLVIVSQRRFKRTIKYNPSLVKDHPSLTKLTQQSIRMGG